MKVVLSVRREKYDQLVVWQTGPVALAVGGCTSPTASVRTSVHWPCTSGIIAPSTLKVSASGPAGGRAACVSRCALACRLAATSIAPAASVRRRAVSG